MVFKLEYEIFGCETWNIILWNAFRAAMPMILGNSHPFDWVRFKKKKSEKPGKVEPVFNIVTIYLI